VARRVNRSLT
jgi:hypothetical protein